MTVVYVDLLWLLNFVANHLLLLGAGRLAGAGLRRWRIALGAALGALYAVALFLPGLGWLSALPCKLAVAVVMVLCAYGGEVRLWRVLGLFFAASAALAGAVLGFEWLGNTTLTLQSGVLYTQMDLRLLLVVFLACYFVFSLLLRRLGAHTGAELVHMELTFPQRVVSMTALHDTGLSLADPVTNRPVVVAYWRDEMWPGCCQRGRMWPTPSSAPGSAMTGVSTGCGWCPTGRWGWSQGCCWPFPPSRCG